MPLDATPPYFIINNYVVGEQIHALKVQLAFLN
jgi:hypothetical protein